MWLSRNVFSLFLFLLLHVKWRHLDSKKTSSGQHGETSVKRWDYEGKGEIYSLKGETQKVKGPGCQAVRSVN